MKTMLTEKVEHLSSDYIIEKNILDLPPIFRCSHCKSEISYNYGYLICKRCGAQFKNYKHILDCRVKSLENTNSQELKFTNRLLAIENSSSFEQMVSTAYQLREESAEKQKGYKAISDMKKKNFLRSYKTKGQLRYDDFLDIKSKLFNNSLKTSAAVDIGCGWGTDLLCLAKHFDTVIGIEISYPDLIIAQKLLLQNGLANFVLVCIDPDNLPLADEIADYVNCQAVIEHVPDKTSFLKEIKRIIRNNGYCYLHSPNRYTILKETHTGVWGVGFLPRKYANLYVKKKVGIEYLNTAPLSYYELERILKRCFGNKFFIFVLTKNIKRRALESKFKEWLGTKNIEILIYLYSFFEKFPLLGKFLKSFVPEFQTIYNKQK